MTTQVITEELKEGDLEYNIDNIKYLVDEGLTTRKIGKIFNKSYQTINYHIKKHNYTSHLKYHKPMYVEDFFNKIDTKEKAYILGFLAGDGDFNANGKNMTVSVCIKDREILDFFNTCTNVQIRTDNKFKKETRSFPNVRCTLGASGYMDCFNKYGIWDYKKNRKYPVIKKDLRNYLLQGFFDAEGHFSWGFRKDRDRLWQRAGFTSSYSLLLGVQDFLDTYGIVSFLDPKGEEDCYELRISNIEGVNDFIDIVYPDYDFIVLKRKFDSAMNMKMAIYNKQCL